MKRRFFYCFSIIPCNFIIFNVVFNLTKINDAFQKPAYANCRAPDRILGPFVYRSYHCYYIYSNN